MKINRFSVLLVGVSLSIAFALYGFIDKQKMISGINSQRLDQLKPTFDVSPSTIENIKITDLNSKDTYISSRSVLYKTSLNGTNPPDGVEFLNGELVKSEDLKYFFEYFLSLKGEISIEEIRSLISTFLSGRVTGDQLDQVLDALHQYDGYLQSMARLTQEFPQEAALRAKLELIKSKRREYFGAHVAREYFGDDEAYDNYQLSRMELMQDKQLSKNDLAQQINELRNQLPVDVRDRENQDEAMKLAMRKFKELSEGASKQEIYQSGVEAFGADIAEKLMQLEDGRLEWKQRYSDYREQVGSIESSGLSKVDRESEIERLQQRLFNQKEILRIKTLDLTH